LNKKPENEDKINDLLLNILRKNSLNRVSNNSNNGRLRRKKKRNQIKKKKRLFILNLKGLKSLESFHCIRVICDDKSY
jgi:hypothetical protein